MGLFSMLFGVGLMIFLDNAKQKVKRPKVLSFWRNLLLLLFGIAHVSIWEGDILVTYALSAFCVVIFPQIRNNKITIFFITFLVFIDLLLINYIGSLYDNSGNLILGSLNEKNIFNSIDLSINLISKNEPGDYMSEDCSDRVIKIIQGYTSVVNREIWKK